MVSVVRLLMTALVTALFALVVSCYDATDEIERDVYSEEAGISEPGAALPDLEVTRGTLEIIEVPPAYQRCQKHSDCMFVRADCGGCCQFAAISSSLEVTYDLKADMACVGARIVCDCTPDIDDWIPRCTDGLCVKARRSASEG